ncbi:PDZ domain-containing protein [Paenibacillus massiliensis]|uniref:PDZ domain-containing protein n=1 Tax=Paenibacillus massiliensis TaxID=225917 RepID=UPI00046EDA82|nr:PDZ domain-containing protein [Paenibacillus massiliensis]
MLEGIIPWGWSLLYGGIQLLAQPFYYITILLVALAYRRQIQLERRLLHTRLHSWVRQTWETVIAGLGAGLLVSLLGMFIGIHLTGAGIVCLWVTVAVLMLFRIRYLCFAYAVGLLGVVQAILLWTGEWRADGWLGLVVQTVRELDMVALLIIVALLHGAEALLVAWRQGRDATPVFMEGKRGRLVGGYLMQSYWPVPLLLLVPVTDGLSLPWPTLLGGEGLYMLAALPVMMGYSGMTTGFLPRQKTGMASRRLVLYSVLLLGLSLIAAWWSPFMIVAALFAFLAHEALFWYDSYEERNAPPLFVHPEEGLRVLAVLPGSPAESLGIQAGESIYKANGILIHTKEELHRALRLNAAFCKLEIRNLQGESKFLQRALYEGDHHQLGLVLAPDEAAGWAVSGRQMSVLQLLGMKKGARRKTRTSTASLPERSEQRAAKS